MIESFLNLLSGFHIEKDYSRLPEATSKTNNIAESSVPMGNLAPATSFVASVLNLTLEILSV
jgi:hypothetical protein